MSIILGKYPIRLLLVFGVLATSLAWGSVDSCIEAIKSTPESLKTSLPANKQLFFNNIARSISDHREEFKNLLLKYDNLAGAELEMELVDRLLRKEIDLEMYNLDHLPTLNNVAVYGATNVPFYTLIAHGVVPKSVAKNVWFRTPEMTRQLYLELYDLLKSKLPEGTLDGLNMISKSQKVQYQTFNKLYVMGMNKRGTRLERLPAEMVS